MRPRLLLFPILLTMLPITTTAALAETLGDARVGFSAERVAGTISKEMMDQLQSCVQVSRDSLKQILVNKNANATSPQVAALEGVIRSLEVNYAESLKANQQQAGARHRQC